jgi:DsbC/DsbD-like thiol-disulfide interchange protein
MKGNAARFYVAVVASGLVLAMGAYAHAEAESPWIVDARSALRLIAGRDVGNADALRAGIEIKLQPGWHTYWRYPGDSGVPPRFNFSGSDNVATVKVLYPAPHALTDETGVTIGYTDKVIFPLRVFPRDKRKPVTLHLKADYAVCEKLCLPVEASAQLVLSAATATSDAALAAAEARVPKQITKAKAGLAARRAGDGPKPLVFVDLPAPSGESIDIFVEGPTPEWALPIPKPVPGAPAGRRRFSFELDGLPPGVDPKGSFELTFTIVRGGKPIEVKSHLD